MSTPTLTDPVLGTLTYKRDSYEWSDWVGRVEFKPGVPVEVIFHEWKYGNETRQDQLAACRDVYLQLVEKEASLRLDLVVYMALDGDWPGAPEPEDTPDEAWSALTDQLRLIRVSLHSDGSAGLDYAGPQAVTGGREIHCSVSRRGAFDGYSFSKDEPAVVGKPQGVVEVLRATELFQAVAKQYPGVEIWPDPEAPKDGCEYAWIMSVEAKAATNLAYFRLQGDSLQLKIQNRDDETRWLDLAGQWLDELLKLIRPRWRFS